MKLMLSALLLSLLFVVGFAQQPTTPPATTQLTIIVAEGDNGSAFIRMATPALDRLQGCVVSTEQRRNPFLNREETKVVFTFPSQEAATNFMFSLTAGTGGGTGDIPVPADGNNYHCEGTASGGMRCVFTFGNYRFICGGGICVQV